MRFMKVHLQLFWSIETGKIHHVKGQVRHLRERQGLQQVRRDAVAEMRNGKSYTDNARLYTAHECTRWWIQHACYVCCHPRTTQTAELYNPNVDATSSAFCCSNCTATVFMLQLATAADVHPGGSMCHRLWGSKGAAAAELQPGPGPNIPECHPMVMRS
jgi:hypothetical protein